MTDSVAKLISLRLLLDWDSRKIWMVRHKISESTTEYKWFKSEELAVRCASMLLNATVEACFTPLPFAFTDDRDEARRQLAIALDTRRWRIQELGYTHELARG